jgi:hypothetical protein
VEEEPVFWTSRRQPLPNLVTSELPVIRPEPGLAKPAREPKRLFASVVAFLRKLAASCVEFAKHFHQVADLDILERTHGILARSSSVLAGGEDRCNVVRRVTEFFPAKIACVGRYG